MWLFLNQLQCLFVEIKHFRSAIYLFWHREGRSGVYCCLLFFFFKYKPPRHFQKIQRSVWGAPFVFRAWRPGLPRPPPGCWPWRRTPESDPCSLQLSCLLPARVPTPDLPKPNPRKKNGIRQCATPCKNTGSHFKHLDIWNCMWSRKV